jgi:DNA-binding NarL/FixJ family response regulator
VLSCIIVDDSATFLDAARRLLRRQGMTVVGVASTGAEALRLVEEQRPDVALVDIGLGAESGLELAGRLDGVRTILISTRLGQGTRAYLVQDFTILAVVAGPAVAAATALLGRLAC